MEEKQSDKNLRFERKYWLDTNKSSIFKNILKGKQFNEIYKKRRVMSLYFDTLNFKFFRENIEGVGNRIKPRLRWYQGIEENKLDEINARLEIKKKIGFVGNKLNFKIGKYKNIYELIKSINQFDFQEKISNIVNIQVFPILITSYDREYYLSKDKLFRSTIDTNLKVSSVKNISHKIPMFKDIMELKYDLINDNNFRNKFISSDFKLRHQKFSKYVVGILNLKKNGLI